MALRRLVLHRIALHRNFWLDPAAGRRPLGHLPFLRVSGVDLRKPRIVDLRDGARHRLIPANFRPLLADKIAFIRADLLRREHDPAIQLIHTAFGPQGQIAVVQDDGGRVAVGGRGTRGSGTKDARESGAQHRCRNLEGFPVKSP
jgi:hypothetical protein